MVQSKSNHPSSSFSYKNESLCTSATLNKTYPVTLPTLKPPKTNATARERSSRGIVLHEVLALHLEISYIINVQWQL